MSIELNRDVEVIGAVAILYGFVVVAFGLGLLLCFAEKVYRWWHRD